MGTVYLGFHVNVCRPVAVKILHSKEVDAEEVKRFHREARAAAAIGHKGIIDIFDVGTTAWGDPYLVMEYLEGESLDSLLERLSPFDLPTACGITEKLLLSLAVAHERGIIHRDIKPGNIFVVCDGEDSKPEIKLIDFGVSKISGKDDVSHLTQAGTFLGTPAYVSPEQANGDAAIDHRVDLYSVGVVLYEMLTGELPFSGKTFNELILKIVSQPPQPPHEVNPSFPSEAEPFLEKALSKSSDDRFQSAAEMLKALRELCSTEAVEQSLDKLSKLIIRRKPSVDPLTETLNGPLKAAMGSIRDLPEDRSAPQTKANLLRRRQRWRMIGNTTVRTRRMLGISLGTVVVLLIAIGFLLFGRATATSLSSESTDPATAIADELFKAEPSAPQPSAEQQKDSHIPNEPAKPAQASILKPQRSKPVSSLEPDTDEPSTQRPKAAPGKRPMGKRTTREGPKKNTIEKDSEVRRFIKGGRQTEIAKDFE